MPIITHFCHVLPFRSRLSSSAKVLTHLLLLQNFPRFFTHTIFRETMSMFLQGTTFSYDTNMPPILHSKKKQKRKTWNLEREKFIWDISYVIYFKTLFARRQRRKNPRNMGEKSEKNCS